MKVYVGSLHDSTVEADLEKMFSDMGNLVSVTLVKDRASGQSKGFGFIEFESRKDGHAAISKLNGQTLNGVNIVVNEAKERNRQHRPERNRRW